jgi:hypothetical protein
VCSLQIPPELGRIAEVAREPQRRVCSDASLPADKVLIG